MSVKKYIILGDFLGSENSILKNPIVGMMVGIMGTVLVQSSSTFTSIIISMVGGQSKKSHETCNCNSRYNSIVSVLNPHEAVPIIFGSNIGTSVTNTIVSLTMAGDRKEFERAFSAATVHDMFNWCTIILAMIIEVSIQVTLSI